MPSLCACKKLADGLLSRDTAFSFVSAATIRANVRTQDLRNGVSDTQYTPYIEPQGEVVESPKVPSKSWSRFRSTMRRRRTLTDKTFVPLDEEVNSLTPQVETEYVLPSTSDLSLSASPTNLLPETAMSQPPPVYVSTDVKPSQPAKKCQKCGKKKRPARRDGEINPGFNFGLDDFDRSSIRHSTNNRQFRRSEIPSAHVSQLADTQKQLLQISAIMSVNIPDKAQVIPPSPISPAALSDSKSDVTESDHWSETATAVSIKLVSPIIKAEQIGAMSISPDDGSTYALGSGPDTEKLDTILKEMQQLIRTARRNGSYSSNLSNIGSITAIRPTEVV